MLLKVSMDNLLFLDCQGIEIIDDVIDITRSADTETSEVTLWETTLQVAKDSFSQVVTPLRIVVKRPVLRQRIDSLPRIAER